MKTLYLNNGLLSVTEDEAVHMPSGTEGFFQEIIARGKKGESTIVRGADGHAEVMLITDGPAAWFEIANDGVLLSESLVVPPRQDCARQWRNFTKRFASHIREGRIATGTTMPVYPGPGPWTAVIVQPVIFQRSDAELGWLERTRLFIADAYVRRWFAKAAKESELI